MTRRLPVVLAALGALLIIASVVAAVVVRSTDTATLALPQRPDSAAVVVTEPGVLSAVDETVTIRALADDDEPVLLAIGRTAEVEAWLSEAEHVRVVGLSSWEELSVEVSTGDAAPTPAPTATPSAEPTESESAAPEATETAPGLPDPAGSDLWIVEASGTGEVEMSWTDQPGRWSLVAATNGQDPAPMVELEWGREARTPWLVPGIIIGALLLAIGATMLVLDGLARREQRRRDEARARDGEWTPSGIGPVATIPVSVEDTDPGTGQRLSRRQIREMEKSVAQAERRRRREADEAPPVPLADDTVAEPWGTQVAAEDETPTTEDTVDVPEEDLPEADAPEADVPEADEPDADEPEGDVPDDGDDVDGVDGVDGADAPEADEADDDVMAPTWRSVWGFGATPVAPQDPPSEDPATDRTEER